MLGTILTLSAEMQLVYSTALLDWVRLICVFCFKTHSVKLITLRNSFKSDFYQFSFKCTFFPGQATPQKEKELGWLPGAWGYKVKHDSVGKVIHWELCKKLKFDRITNGYMHKPEPIFFNEPELMCFFTVTWFYLSLSHTNNSIYN